MNRLLKIAFAFDKNEFNLIFKNITKIKNEIKNLDIEFILLSDILYKKDVATLEGNNIKFQHISMMKKVKEIFPEIKTLSCDRIDLFKLCALDLIKSDELLLIKDNTNINIDILNKIIDIEIFNFKLITNNGNDFILCNLEYMRNNDLIQGYINRNYDFQNCFENILYEKSDICNIDNFDFRDLNQSVAIIENKGYLNDILKEYGITLHEFNEATKLISQISINKVGFLEKLCKHKKVYRKLPDIIMFLESRCRNES